MSGQPAAAGAQALRAAADDLANHDVVLVTLDSLRFDTASEANVPHLDALGPLRRAASYGSFTLPSHAAIFGGFLPNVTEEPQWDFYSRERRQLWRLSRARQQATPRTSTLLRGDTVVEGFAAAGYRTVGAGGVRWFSSGHFPALFDTFHYWGPTGDGRDKFAERHEGDFALDHVEKLAGEVAGAERAFLFVNAAETHAPYTRGTGDAYDAETQRVVRAWSGSWNGGDVVPSTEAARQDMTRLREAQRIALEDADRKLGLLFDALPRPAVVVVCADHGEAFGEAGWWGHNQPVPEVMQVPMWIGVLPGGRRCQTAVT